MIIVTEIAVMYVHFRKANNKTSLHVKPLKVLIAVGNTNAKCCSQIDR